MVQPKARGHACSHGNALAQRTGVGLDAGQLAQVGVALQAAAQLLQGAFLFLREKAQVAQGCVLNQRGVALAEQEAVPVGHMGIGGVNLHFLIVQHGDDVRQGAGAAQMADLAHADHPGHVLAQLQGLFLQCQIIHLASSILCSPRALRPGAGRHQALTISNREMPWVGRVKRRFSTPSCTITTSGASQYSRPERATIASRWPSLG